MKNKIFAIDAAPDATPPNPKIAAIMATIRNMTVQRNIIDDFSLEIVSFCLYLENTVPHKKHVDNRVDGMNLVFYMPDEFKSRLSVSVDT